MEALAPLAPLLESKAFQRLRTITFLGALSPRYAEHGLGQRTFAPGTDDGSRADHSVGVALLAQQLARSLNFSETTQRYAAAWGLLHDIGNWPLSHTGEYAFSQLTNLTPRTLRREIMLGSPKIAASYSVHGAIAVLQLDIDHLFALLEHRASSLPGELRGLSTILASPITPDAVEGMWRCGMVLGDDTVDRERVVTALSINRQGDFELRPSESPCMLAFWLTKVRLYRTFFNDPQVIRLESAWSQAILGTFPRMSASDSMEVSEVEVVARVRKHGLPVNPPFSRYKTPVEYALDRSYLDSSSKSATLDQLRKAFVARPMENWLAR